MNISLNDRINNIIAHAKRIYTNYDTFDIYINEHNIYKLVITSKDGWQDSILEAFEKLEDIKEFLNIKQINNIIEHAKRIYTKYDTFDIYINEHNIYKLVITSKDGWQDSILEAFEELDDIEEFLNRTEN